MDIGVVLSFGLIDCKATVGLAKHQFGKLRALIVAAGEVLRGPLALLLSVLVKGTLVLRALRLIVLLGPGLDELDTRIFGPQLLVLEDPDVVGLGANFRCVME